MKELVGKMLETEREDWDSTTPPDADVDGAFYTTLGITLFQMIDQNVRLCVGCVCGGGGGGGGCDCVWLPCGHWSI